MSITIEHIEPLGHAPVHHGFAIRGAAHEAQQDIQVYFETLINGVQSANVRAVSDEHGRWMAVFPGDFQVGTEITAYARGGRAELAWKTQRL